MSSRPSHVDTNAWKQTITSVSSGSRDERELVKRLRRKDYDHEAWRELVDSHQDKVYNHALHLLGNREDAEDIAQEVIITAIRSIGKFRGDSKISTWLITITINLCRNKYRKSKRFAEGPLPERESFETGPNELLGVGKPAGDPEDTLKKKEKKDSLWSRVDELEPIYRIPLILVYKLDHSYKEASTLTGLPVGTIKSQVSRALSMLKKDNGIDECRE